MKKKYLQLLEDLKAKNFSGEQINEAITKKAKEEIENMQFHFSGIKSEGEGESKTVEIEGYASTKDVDRYGDIVEPEAFKNTMEVFMKNPVLLLQHKHDKPIGSVTEFNIDEKGLYIKGEVKHNDDGVQDKIESKTLRGFSIGFRIKQLRVEEVRNDDGDLIDLLWIIEELELLEISVVSVPANPYTLMKSLEGLKAKSLEAIKDSENVNDNQEDNANDNADPEVEEEAPEEEEEKSVEGEEEEDKEEVETPEEEVAEDDEEAETEEDTEEEDEVDDTKNIDNEDEEDTVEDEEEETEDAENPTETEDVEDDGETEETDDAKALTTKLIKSLVDTEVSKVKAANKKEFDEAVKSLEENFKKELEERTEEMYKTLKETLGEFEKLVKHNEELSERLKEVKKGKGYISMPSFKEKKEGEDRIKSILSGIRQDSK